MFFDLCDLLWGKAFVRSQTHDHVLLAFGTALLEVSADDLGSSLSSSFLGEVERTGWFWSLLFLWTPGAVDIKRAYQVSQKEAAAASDTLSPHHTWTWGVRGGSEGGCMG